MTSDDGFGSDFTSGSDLRARFAAAIQESGMTFSEVCRRAGVSETEAQQAIEEGTYGFPRTMNVLVPLMNVLGLDNSYIGRSGSGPNLRKKSKMEVRRAARTLAWDFALRNKKRVPRSHRRPLASYCADLAAARLSHTVVKAARPQAPRTTIDVSFIYERLLREGFFDRMSE